MPRDQAATQQVIREEQIEKEAAGVPAPPTEASVDFCHRNMSSDPPSS